jgi:hypothetical protein
MDGRGGEMVAAAVPLRRWFGTTPNEFRKMPVAATTFRSNPPPLRTMATALYDNLKASNFGETSVPS